MAYQDVVYANEFLLKQALTHENPYYRYFAALKIGLQNIQMQEELIELLHDDNIAVNQVARRSLVILSIKRKKPIDFGPLPGVDKIARINSALEWKKYWDEIKKTEEKINNLPPKKNH